MRTARVRCVRGSRRQVCFNGVAIVFLLDFDFYMFQYWLREQHREHMEEFGAPMITRAEADYLASVKRAMTLLVFAFIIIALGLTDAWEGSPLGQDMSTLFIPLFVVYDAVTRWRLLKQPLAKTLCINCVALVACLFFVMIFTLGPVVKVPGSVTFVCTQADR